MNGSREKIKDFGRRLSATIVTEEVGEHGRVLIMPQREQKSKLGTGWRTMRLIDATIQPMVLVEYILERKDTFARVLEKGDNDYLFGLLMDYFNEQPTAYDVDVVVSELGRASGIARPVGWSHKKEIVELKTAIEIVKAGGIDGN